MRQAEPELGEETAEGGTVRRLTPLTFGLLAVNVVAFFLAERVGKTTEVQTLLRVGAVERYHVWLGEWWRLVTPMFLHIGLAHLVWNGYASLGWCRPVERALGSVRFGLLYVLGGIGASAASVVGHDVVSAGASGAVFSITGAAMVIRMRHAGSLKALLANADARRTLVSIAIWCGIGVWLGLDNYAHVGGLVVGLVLTAAMTGPDKAARRKLFAAFATAFVALVAFALRPWWTPSIADGEALASYGSSYYLGEKLTKDGPRAFRFSSRACDASSANGCAIVGFMYSKGDVVPKDDARAASFYQRGCDGKSPFGCAALGRVTMLGLGVEKDPAKANVYFSQACDLGQADGCAGFGISLYQGTGVVRDPDRGLTILEQACQAGSQIACKMRLEPEAKPEW